LELGAGVGLAGLALAASGFAAEVVLTDGNPTAVAALQGNVQRNAASFGATKVSADLLHWATYDGALGTFDVIIAADWCDWKSAIGYATSE
jgi:predicted nicotinamide N-methyase